MKKSLILIFIFFCTKQLYGFSVFTGFSKNLAEFEQGAGLALVAAGNYKAAHTTLEFALLRGSMDSRLFYELAGISYKMGDPQRAKRYLNNVLKETPSDNYANHFLGTLYLMDGNIEACLKYWNRIGEPRIEGIELQPSPPVNPVFMDRALVMAPATYLTREDFLETDSRLQMMGIFRKHEFRLRPRRVRAGATANSFDLILRPQLKNGTFESKLKIASLVVQGIFTETIKPEFHNISGTTASSVSFISWDEYKNRFYSSLSLPFQDNPHSRIRLFTEGRHETWSLRSDVDLLKWEAGVELGETSSERFRWSGGAKISTREYRNVSSENQHLFQDGWKFHAFGGSDFSLLRIPERRFTLQSKSLVAAGASPSRLSGFVSLEQSIEMRWFPHPSNEDLSMTARLQAGKMFGSPSFDEYFVLGADRDSPLLLRAHRSSIEKKGENPFGPGYLLMNWEINKYLLNTGKFRWRLSPFLDAGTLEENEIWEGNQLFLDTGIQSGFQIFGSIELIFTYGKDLRSGRNVAYLSARL